MLILHIKDINLREGFFKIRLFPEISNFKDSRRYLDLFIRLFVCEKAKTPKASALLHIFISHPKQLAGHV